MIKLTYRHRSLALLPAIMGLGIALIAVPAERAHAQLGALMKPPRMRAEPMFRIGFGGGMSVPRTGMRDAVRSGINGQGFLLVRLPGGLPALRLALDYQKFDFKETARSAASGLTSGALAADGQTETIGGVGGFRMELFSGPVRPYVLAGVGAFSVRSAMALASGASESSAETNFGVDGGAGIALKIGRLDAFIEARLQNVYTNTGFVDTKSIQAIPITFGILF